MDIKLLKSTNLNGQVLIPGDKSISHRSIILSAIAEGISEISGYLKGEDCLATLNAFKQIFRREVVRRSLIHNTNSNSPNYELSIS